MHSFRNVLLLFSLLVVKTPFTDMNLLHSIEDQIIHKCEEKGKVPEWRTVSTYIDEVMKPSKIISITEPQRITFFSSLPLDHIQGLEGKWIKIYFLLDHPVCFHIDYPKTEKMKEKSEILQRQLQENMNKRN